MHSSFRPTLLAAGLVASLFCLAGCKQESATDQVESNSKPNPIATAKETPSDEKKFQGKTLDEWIAQAKAHRKGSELSSAFGVLHVFGQQEDREKTLRFYMEALASDSLMVQGFAASGLTYAGRPTTPEAASDLLKVLTFEVTGDERRAQDRGSAIGDRTDLSLVQKLTNALKVVGETEQIPALRELAKHEKVNLLMRPMIEKTILEIEKRADPNATVPE